MPAYNEFLLPYKNECEQLIVSNTPHVADDIICVTEATNIEKQLI